MTYLPSRKMKHNCYYHRINQVESRYATKETSCLAQYFGIYIYIYNIFESYWWMSRY